MNQDHGLPHPQGSTDAVGELESRLATLETTLKRLIGELVATTKAGHASQPGTGPAPGPSVRGDARSEGAGLSRRGLILTGAGAAAAAVAAATGVAAAHPAAAANGASLIVGSYTNASSSPTELTYNSGVNFQEDAYGFAVIDQSTFNGVFSATPAIGAVANYKNFACGVQAVAASDATGVQGESDSGAGIRGMANSGYGVIGRSGYSTGWEPIAGVTGVSLHQYGIAGTSSTAAGVYGWSDLGMAGEFHCYNTLATNPTVLATADSDGPVVSAVTKTGSGLTAIGGVVGDCKNSTGVVGLSAAGSGVYGVATGKSGFSGVGGVVGESSSNYGTCGFSASRAGVRAASTSAEGVKATSTSSVGGAFAGGRAAINLTPTTTIGRPTTGSHSAGDLVVDKAGSLFLCTTAGTPGKWVKVTVTAA